MYCDVVLFDDTFLVFVRRSFASGLPAQITASLNIGLSGMPFSGSDIGKISS